MKKLTLHAWFQPKSVSRDFDLKESLRAKQLLGRWPLKFTETRRSGKLFVCEEKVGLPDGKMVRLLARYKEGSSNSSTEIDVDFGDERFTKFSSNGDSGLSAIITTGNGGFLSIILIPAHEFPKKRA